MWIKRIFPISLADAEKAFNAGELHMSVLHSKSSYTLEKPINQLTISHSVKQI